ncbi:hypothetical protein CTZ27_35970 [Streptomyces griseocarneus]|nr:hypothetical protein CTZ27_35970 [Streptomyces griseocarneus]
MPIPDFIRDIRATAGHQLLWLPGVSVIVLDDAGRVLLGRRADTGEWSIIGGIPEPGEQPAAAVVREVYEETAVHCVTERVLLVQALEPVTYPNGDHCQFMDICFLARATGGEARVNDDESLEVGWFEPDALPPMEEFAVTRIKQATEGGPTWFEGAGGGLSGPRAGGASTGPDGGDPVMDVAGKLSALPGAQSLPGVSNAWKWSPAPGFTLLAALSMDHRHVFRLNTKDSYDAELCCAVLGFVRDREDEVVGRPEPLIALTGFTWPGRGFDVIGRIRPEAHRLFPGDLDLNSVTFGVFPGYSSEISGAESVDQAAERFSRMLKPSDLDRKPSPYVLIRFDNPRTGAGTVGELPVFVPPDYLLHELRLLEGVRDARLELWNHRNEKWTVRWEDGRWCAVGNDRELRMPADEAAVWAAAVIG